MIRTSNRGKVLKSNFECYLRDVCKVSDSSVDKYIDALNNISRRLVAKGLVQQDIYEITELDKLRSVREILFADQDFKDQNLRGKQRYSAGLNHYCAFASGKGFGKLQGKQDMLDIPVSPEEAVIVHQTVWKRSSILRLQAIEMANYKCEIDPSHQTFISENTHMPYMEGHHVLPMNCQSHFSVSLDVYANIICLCPTCHRKIHYGLVEDRVSLLNDIYDQREARLKNSGIDINKNDFLKMIIGS